jgi:hypothetical protein
MASAHYEITVEGHLDRSHWSRWFEEMQVTLTEEGTTVISGPVADQAALHGLLAKIRDLGLPLVSVKRVESDPQVAFQEKKPCEG